MNDKSMINAVANAASLSGNVNSNWLIQNLYAIGQSFFLYYFYNIDSRNSSFILH